ncbi:MAG TPA: hypothetical protein VFK59_07945 [Actinomycetota bacterium]|nr:hypothetical protein [Actinomycetota bacterium]
MRYVRILAPAVVFTALMATPASAAQVSVLASENVTLYDDPGEYCGVFVDDYDDNEIEAYCLDENGHTWVKVRVPGVDGAVTSVKVTRRGDCSGVDIGYRKRGDVVTVKIDERGEFDCYYKRVVVRFS